MNTRIKDHPTSQNLIQARHIKEEIDVPSVEILNMLTVLNVLQESFNARPAIKYGHFISLCYKKEISFKSRNPKAHQLQAGVVYVQEDSICSQSSDLTFIDESFYLQVEIKCTQAESKFPHLIISLLILPTI